MKIERRVIYHFPSFLTASPSVPTAPTTGARLIPSITDPPSMTKPAYWDEATAALARCDPVLRGLIRCYPVLQLKLRRAPSPTLARAIVGQQISVKAPDAIWGRFAALVSSGPSQSFP